MLDHLVPVAGTRPAGAVVEALGLGGSAATRNGRPRVAAAMIASADGRAAVAGALVLRDVHRAGEHLFTHDAAAA